MEQESETPLLYDASKRVKYKLMLAIHVIFIAIALGGTVVLLAVLLLGELS